MAEAWDEEICLSLLAEEAQAAGDDFLGVSGQLVGPTEDGDFGYLLSRKIFHYLPWPEPSWRKQ